MTDGKHAFDDGIAISMACLVELEQFFLDRSAALEREQPYRAHRVVRAALQLVAREGRMPGVQAVEILGSIPYFVGRRRNGHGFLDMQLESRGRADAGCEQRHR